MYALAAAEEVSERQRESVRREHVVRGKNKFVASFRDGNRSKVSSCQRLSLRGAEANQTAVS